MGGYNLVAIDVLDPAVPQSPDVRLTPNRHSHQPKIDIVHYDDSLGNAAASEGSTSTAEVLSRVNQPDF